jgi:ribosome-binding ATPase YchF (GTP1/OBG family)
MNTAIIGLPMVGKTSLFTILTAHETAVSVLDGGSPRRDQSAGRAVEALEEVFQASSPTPLWSISISLDLRQRCEPKYLASMRLADALAHVLRVSTTTPSLTRRVWSTGADLEDVETELILSDLMMMEKTGAAGEGPQEDQKARSRSRVRAAHQSRLVLEDNKPLRPSS